MRNVKLAVLVLLAAGGAAIAGPTPAAAYDFPYCIQGGGWAFRAIAPTGPMPSARLPSPADTAIATSIRASPLPGRNIGNAIGITTVAIN
jgi:hypothetical protein